MTKKCSRLAFSMKKENINNYKIIENINSQGIITELRFHGGEILYKCSKSIEHNNENSDNETP